MRRSPFLRLYVLAGIWVLALCLLGVLGFYTGVRAKFQAPSELIDQNGAGVQVLDRNGQLLFEFAGPNGEIRTPVPLKQMSPDLVNATIATEDDNFWQNPGVNFRGLMRAAYENLAFWKNGGLFHGPGGSSITQQLAKNLYIPEDERSQRSLDRKIKETVLAFELNRRYSKEQILEWYLNDVFYGNYAWGVEAASKRYFDRHASELDLAEASMLAGIPAAPANFDPLHDPFAAKQRQQQVLDLMVRQGKISQDQAKAAAAEQLSFRTGSFPINAPHFVMYVRDLLPKLMDGNPGGGLRITTTLDLGMQKQAEAVLQAHRQGLKDEAGANNAGLVALDPRTGEILAMAGGMDFFDDGIQGQVNNVTALNRPGSTLKPIVYLEALMHGWSPATIVEDQPIPFTDGSRSYLLGNPDGKYRERVSLRRALANSLNPPAVRALEYAGGDDVRRLMTRMGITTVPDGSGDDPSLALGGLDASLLDLTYAYSTLAGYGEHAGTKTVLDLPDDSRGLDPVAVLRVEDTQGNVVWSNKERKETAAPARESYLITNVLSDNAARGEVFGPDSALQLDRPAAAKTGLSDENRDAWTIGYTPDLVAGVWVGNTDNTPMAPSATSAATAAPVWHDFMTQVYSGKPVVGFPVPDGISVVEVCTATGMLPTPRCPQKEQEPFLSELAPNAPGSALVEAQAPAPAIPTPAPAPPPAPAPAGGGAAPAPRKNGHGHH